MLSNFLLSIYLTLTYLEFLSFRLRCVQSVIFVITFFIFVSYFISDIPVCIPRHVDNGQVAPYRNDVMLAKLQNTTINPNQYVITNTIFNYYLFVKNVNRLIYHSYNCSTLLLTIIAYTHIMVDTVVEYKNKIKNKKS